MKKITLFLAFSMIFSFHASADHNAGGKLSWECIKSGPNTGKFRFTLHLYRFCTGIPLSSFAFVSTTHPIGSLNMNRITVRDISPACNTGQEIDCYTSGKEDFAIEEHVYQSGFVTLAGVPPAGGWSFQWNSCCRPDPVIYNMGQLVDNLHPQNQSYRVQAIMYPYNNQSTNPCYDSSPTFAETPATIICTDYAFNYNHNAQDAENDSLAYAFTPALQSGGNSVGYATHLNTSQVTPRPDGGNFIVPAPGFSATVPLPWAHANMNLNNVPAVLNPTTGEISFTSYTPGSYATSIRADAFKCGQLVASIFIDIPVFLIDCDPLPPPFNFIYNVPPDVSFIQSSGVSTSLNVSVLAGEVVEFEIQASDAGVLPGFFPQTIKIVPSAKQFSPNYTDTLTGCPDTPCATVDTSGLYHTIETGVGGPHSVWQGIGQISADFRWRTDCNHLAKAISSCFVRSNVYTFIFKVLDDYCPAPGANFVTASITVNAPDPLDPPVLKCASIQPNGDVDLSWNVPVPDSADTSNAFRKYVIFRSSTRSAVTYTAIDTILNQDFSTYTDVGANAHVTPKYYFIMGVSSCNDQAQTVWSDTISTLTLNATAIALGDSVHLTYPHFVEPGTFPSTTTGQYYIWQVYNNDTTLVMTTTSNDVYFPVYLCDPSVADYYVEVRDTTAIWGCSSYSNTRTLSVGDRRAPTPPVIKTASVSGLGTIDIDWSPSPEPDLFKYYIWENGVLVDSIMEPDSSLSLPIPSGTNINVSPANYSISVSDTCGNVSNPGFAHTTMEAFIDGNGVVRCETAKRIPIRFTSYAGWAVQEYVIFADSGTGFYPIDTVVPPVTFPYTFNHTDINTNFYTYLVRAYDGNGLISESSVDTISMTIVDGTVVAAPDVRCVNMNANGDVVISWILPPNPSGNFDSYQIYHSTDGTNFSLLDSITGVTRSDNSAYDSTQYVHVGPTGSKHYYQVYSRSGCYGFSLSAPSNTIQLLDLDVAQVGTDVNQIQWDFTPLPTSGPTYSIMREYPLGTPYQLIASKPLNENAMFDTLAVCNDTANYQVIIGDGSGCTSSSSIELGIFKDNVPPAKQFLDSVSVTGDTNAIVGWSPNPSGDVVEYYVIQQLGSGGYTIVDTVNSNTLSNLVLNASGCFAIAAIDSCGNDNLSGQDFDFHCTMTTSVEVDRCDESFLVQWNGYNDFTSGTNVQYEVFASVNAAGFQSIGVTTETNFRFSSAVSGSDYCFMVRATENGGAGPFTSTSDSICVTAQFLVRPEYAYLQHVTVKDSNNVEISVLVDLQADVSEYLIKRGLDTNNFKTIKTIQAPKRPAPSDTVVTFGDLTARTSQKVYFYRVEVIDPCGEPVFTSNMGKNILLSVDANNEVKENALSWTSYLDWEGGVQAYKVYRSNGGPYKFLETVQIKNEDPSENNYTDDVSLFIGQSEGLFCYYVEAQEGTPLFSRMTEPATSRSNEVCVVQYPLFYIPSAFTPGKVTPGLNDVFKPEGVFIDFDDYSFEVYNRWGEKVFSTKSFKQGWDGSVEGNDAPTGAYIYVVRYQSSDGKEFQQKGTVTITR